MENSTDDLRRTKSHDQRPPKSSPSSSPLPSPSHHLSGAYQQQQQQQPIDRRATPVQPAQANLEPAARHSVSIDPSTWGNHREQLIRRLSRSSDRGVSFSTQSPDEPHQHHQSASWSENPGFLDPRSSLSRHIAASRAHPRHSNAPPDLDSRRLSFTSSIYSLGAMMLGGSLSTGPSSAGSVVGSEPDDSREGPSPGSTTATSPLMVSAGHSAAPGTVPTHWMLNATDSSTPNESALPSPSLGATVVTGASTSQVPTPRPHPVNRGPARNRWSVSRKVSGQLNGSASPASERSWQSTEPRRPTMGTIGVCALDSKARSKPCRNILNRINANQEFEVIIFGDKVILDEGPENWPLCDYLISFFSDGFPLDKAIEYVRLRKPYSVNDLPMQMVLWDRRLCLRILDKYEVRTPKRLEVTRDGGPRLPTADLAQHLFNRTGMRLEGSEDGTGGGQAPPREVIMLDDDTFSVDGATLKKPFVEKPVNGEDHNIYIYYHSDVGGGGRRLFRKVNNKSSDADDTLKIPRSITDTASSYIYESFLSTQNHEDVKAYTVGSEYCHAETRKSPVVDGIVKRNTHGKEMRYVTALTAEETRMASRVSEAFGQRICGFDLLRAGERSYVIDVNGWSFVKDNNEYYDKCASILKQLFVDEKSRKEAKQPAVDGENQVAHGSPNKPATGHLSTIKNILKSPSMTRLHHPHLPVGHHHHHQSRHTRSSSGSEANPPSSLHGQTLPLSSPPTTENTSSVSTPALIKPDSLPPSAVTADALTDEQIALAADQAPVVPPPASKAQWKLKGMVAVIRHADRTPKQKFKFTFHTKPFVDLLKGHREEVLLIGEAALSSVMDAVKVAISEGKEDPEKLKLLRTSLAKKGAWPGTKVQIKPMFRKKKEEEAPTPAAPNGTPDQANVNEAVEQVDSAGHQVAKQKRQGSLTGMTLSRAAAAEENLDIEKLQLIVKWGGEPTHSARYQSQELGENMRNDLLLMNRDALDNVKVYSSSERRVTTSANIWTTAFLDQPELPSDFIQVRKDLLDDSNAAKDEMDKVKKKLKTLLRKGNKAPSQFAWPENMPDPYLVARNVVELMQFHRRVMRANFQKLYGGAASSLAANLKSPNISPSASTSSSMSQIQNINNIQNRWCSGEDAELFKERWEKLFAEFCDPEKVDPSKISELHDTMKFDALHNRQFLEWVFTPPPEMLDIPDTLEDSTKQPTTDSSESSSTTGKKQSTSQPGDMGPPKRSGTVTSTISDKADKADKTEKISFGERFGFRKKSIAVPGALEAYGSNSDMQSYFNLFQGNPRSKSKNDVRLEKLRELFLYSKILFDFIGPQEYGITDSEKLEIGLLTSLPLLREIVYDLEDMQASEGAKTAVYFTKESHIYTLLNCIIEGGIKTKIDRNKIPELDYLSTICFELYESQNTLHDDAEEPFNYSIRITISPGCHTFEPLDVVLDSKHCIGFAQRRSLTAHNDWKQVIETLRAKFHTVKLPKSFIAVNLAEKTPGAFQHTAEAKDELKSSPVALRPPQLDDNFEPQPPADGSADLSAVEL